MDISKIVGIIILIILIVTIIIMLLFFVTEREATFFVRTMVKRYDESERVSSFLASKYNGKKIYYHLVDICDGRESPQNLNEYLNLLAKNRIFVFLDFCNVTLYNYDLESLNLTEEEAYKRGYDIDIYGDREYKGKILIYFLENE